MAMPAWTGGDRVEPIVRSVRINLGGKEPVGGGGAYSWGMGAVAEEHLRGEADPSAKSWNGEWTRVLGHLKEEVGDAAYRSWLQPTSLSRCDDGHAIVAAPTRFLRDWVATHYADRLLALWRAENRTVTRISVVVGVTPGRDAIDYS